MRAPSPVSGQDNPEKKTKLVTGGVYILREAVSTPDGHKAGNRKAHDFRAVILLSNQTICNSIASPVVTIAPLSSKLVPRAETDLIIGRSTKNGLEHDSRIMFGYVQPVLKDELERQIGELDDREWDSVMAKILWNFDR
jgi:mRNA-degrading endonuclease toxin of MazEF toxin-antitoxin module